MERTERRMGGEKGGDVDRNLTRTGNRRLSGEQVAEKVGQGMKAHLNVDRNDPVEEMRERGGPKE